MAASSIYQLLPREGILHEHLTRASAMVSEYCQDRRAVAYGCAGLLGFGLSLAFGRDVRHRLVVEKFLSLCVGVSIRQGHLTGCLFYVVCVIFIQYW